LDMPDAQASRKRSFQACDCRALRQAFNQVCASSSRICRAMTERPRRVCGNRTILDGVRDSRPALLWQRRCCRGTWRFRFKPERYGFYRPGEHRGSVIAISRAREKIVHSRQIRSAMKAWRHAAIR
jgi:hypothetical protein